MFGHLFGDLALAIGHDVAVDAVDHVHRRVPHVRDDVLIRRANGDHDGGMVVPQIVEAVVHAELLQEALEAARNRVGGELCDAGVVGARLVKRARGRGQGAGGHPSAQRGLRESAWQALWADHRICRGCAV